MDGVLFLLSVIGVGLVMWWVIQNEVIAPGGRTSGIFAMQDSPDGPVEGGRVRAPALVVPRPVAPNASSRSGSPARWRNPLA